MDALRFFWLAAALAAAFFTTGAEAAKIKSRVDKFDGVVHLSAPWKHKFFGGSYQLRAHYHPDDGSAVYFVHVENEHFEANRGGYSGSVQRGANPQAFRDFYTAVDPEGQTYEVEAGEKSFDGCNESFCYYEEDFAIVIPAPALEAAGGDFAIRALSRAKIALTLEVPGDHIRSLVARVAEERAKRPGPGR